MKEDKFNWASHRDIDHYSIFVTLSRELFFVLKFTVLPHHMNSARSAAALVFDLLSCSLIEKRWETERGQSPEYILKSWKKHPVAN